MIGLRSACLTVTLAAIVSATAPASAVTLVDQSTLLPSNGGGSAGNGVGYAGTRNPVLVELLQTFTVGLSGTFAGVDVQLSITNRPQPNFDLVAEIVTLDDMLQPDVILGFDSIAPTDVTSTNNSFSELVSFDIAGFEVMAGDMLGLVLRPDGGSRGLYVSPFEVSGVEPNYAGGDLLASINSGAFSSRGGDIGFRTLVTAPVPLPAGLPLLLAGLGGFALLRFRARKS